MAFKTGTSYGFRDAVAAGRVGELCASSCGPAGRTAERAGGPTGRDASLPLLFDAADVLISPQLRAPIRSRRKEAPLA